MSKPAGVSFNKYVAIAGRVLRRALKEDQRISATKVDTLETRAAKWNAGKQSETEILSVGLKKTVV